MPPLNVDLPTPLITAEALAARLDRVRLLDVRFDLARPEAGRQAFRHGHVPGATYVHLDEDLSAKGDAQAAVCGGRHPLPNRAQVARLAARLRLTPSTPVVVYDAQGGMFAARLWWMLKWIGHGPVAVLDGGWPAWVASGGVQASGEGQAVPAADPYPLSDEPGCRTITADELLSQLGRRTVLDARAPERYRGDVEPLDPVAGHIPGALNRPFGLNLGADGCFLPPQTLRAALEQVAPDPLDWIHQCGSGVTACHNLLAMAVAGWPMGVLYPGSWSEWCADPARPVATGA